jgi:hypothetical protein
MTKLKKEVVEKYRFNDFTLDNYKRLLRIAKKNYSFILFNQINCIEKKSILLRHDVEFSVPIALKMAKIEADLGINSTYFVQLHSDFYNALEKNTFKQLSEIEALGHTLALHFDSHFWGINNELELEKYLAVDANTFKTYFGEAPYVFSFHNTNSFIMSCEKEYYSGLINVYSKSTKENIGYCTDSTGFWRYEIMEDILQEAKVDRLQILFHDGMWQDEILPPRRRVHKVIDDHANFMKFNYDEGLIKLGAKNIDWEG